MRVENLWLSFRSSVIHPDAPEQQLKEMKLAFYGGASSIYYELIRMLDPGDEPTPNDMAKMRELDAELKSFNEKVKRGGL